MPLNNYGIVGPNIGRCAQPDAHGFKMLHAMGYEIIAKLNTEEESSYKEEARLFGATDGRMVIQYPNISPFNPETTRIRAIAEEILRLSVDQRVLMHCMQGRDRAGMVTGAIRLIEGWTLEATLEEFKSYGESFWAGHAYREAIRRLDAELRAK